MEKCLFNDTITDHDSWERCSKANLFKGPMILNTGVDPVRLEAYFGDYRNDAFYDMLTKAWLLNWFGAVFIDWRTKEMGVDIKSMTSVSMLKDIIIKMLNNRV